MKENLVQWTLLQNLDTLSKLLDFEINKKIGQEITTDYGKVDFVLESKEQEQLLVELETTLNSKSKLDYCFQQTLN
jgi:DNA-binding sugar fermentation-stimulating protein